MASMITGEFVEAYVRRNTCKEELRKAAEASTAGGVAAAAQGEKKAGASASSSSKKAAKEAAPAAGSSKGEGGSRLFGLVKKKVHPRVGESAGASSGAPDLL